MTLRPRRQNASLDDFQDPLDIYEPPAYADDTERALAEQSVADMKIAPYKTVAGRDRVRDAVQTMIDLDIACVLVVDDQDRLIGIFSERDVQTKLADRFEHLQHQPVSNFMTPDPTIVHDTDSPAKALNLMAIGGFRHIPVVDADERVVGILGPRRITHYLDQIFQQGL